MGYLYFEVHAQNRPQNFEYTVLAGNDTFSFWICVGVWNFI